MRHIRDHWFELVDDVLRPARSDLARFMHARDEHLAVRRASAAARKGALAACERRIEHARDAVFAAADGVVGSTMTELEREWRILARPDPDGGLMDLWARIAPPDWIDRKRWRDVAPDARVDVAISLVADVEGVEAAEAAVEALRTALVPWGTPLANRIRWQAFERDDVLAVDLLAAPAKAACEAVSTRESASVVERAERLANELRGAIEARLPERPAFARDVAHAAFVDYVWRVAALDAPNPTAPLRALWKSGYALAAVDATAVTLELPPLSI